MPANVGGQSIRGNQNVQIEDVDRSLIQIIYEGVDRTVPLEPARVPVAAHLPSPARLVRAHSGVVPYVGRHELLADLKSWIDTPVPFGGHVIGGRGGSGKTRLAVKLCEDLRDRNWLCGFLARIADQAMLDSLVQAPTARLVVIDYAESRVEQLEFLLPLLKANATREEPVRVLLLVRTSPAQATDWSQRLRNRIDGLDALLDECAVRVLEETPLGAGERTDLFSTAAVAFAERLELPPGDPTPPTEFDDDLFSSPLMVVIAAFLAIHGEAVPPSTRSGLLDEVLEHEQRYWRDSATGISDDQVLLRRVVALGTLASAESEAAAAELLRLLPDLADAPAERRTRLARWVRDQYPGPRWWNPLEPDLVGEHLVAECFTEQQDVLRGVLAGADQNAITRPLEVLARSAPDHPDLTLALQSILGDALAALCSLAAGQAETVRDRDLLYGNAVTVAAAVDAVVAVVPVEGRALSAGLSMMPMRSDLVLNELAVTLSSQKVERLRLLTPDESVEHERTLARALNNLSVHLSYTGRRKDALEANEESLGIYRRLVAADASAHEPELARALINLTAELAYEGRHTEALAASEESVAIRRRLADADPDAYNADLALSLNNLSNDLANVGRDAEALAAGEESRKIYSRLADADPDAYNPDLALSLNNLSNTLREEGHYKEALAASSESVAIRRRLTAANPAAYEPGLAMALANFSIHVADTGRSEDAAAASEEAAEIFRRLVAANPDAYARDLARVLEHLGHRLAEAGREEDAERVHRELASLTVLLDAPTKAVKPRRGGV